MKGYMIGFSKAVAVVASITIALAAIVLPVGAQNSSPASGLRISPTRAELSVERGQKGEARFSVRNITAGAISVRAILNDFEPQEDGRPMPLREGETNAASLKNIITLPEDIVLAEDESQDIVIPVTIPENQAPGAYYGVVLFQGLPVTGNNEPGQVSLTGSVGGIVLISVPGEVRESMQLVSIRAGRASPATNNEIQLSNIFAQPFDRVQIRINNTGNSFLKPFGKVAITDWRGREVAVYEMNDTDPRANVLPGSGRVFIDTISGVGVPGLYTITAGISYGDGGDVLTQRVNVWYLPIWLVITTVLVISGLVFVALRLIKSSPRR